MYQIRLPNLFPYRIDTQRNGKLHHDNPDGEVMAVHQHKVGYRQQDEFESFGPMDTADEQENRACRGKPDEAINATFVRQIN